MHKNNEGKLFCILSMCWREIPSTGISVLFEIFLFPLSYVPKEALVWNENGEDKGCNLNLHKRVNLKYEKFTNQ